MSTRRETDIRKLMRNNHKVEMIDDGMIGLFHVHFHGPEGSLYQGGLWKVRVVLPNDYPNKPPSINFVNKIYHPNIDKNSGSVCMDVIDHNWNPLSDLVHVFEWYLPHLLQNPNDKDPLNIKAACLLRYFKTTYEEKVKNCCKKHAKPEDIGLVVEKKSIDEEMTEDEESSDEDMTEDEESSDEEMIEDDESSEEITEVENDYNDELGAHKSNP